MSYTPGGVYPEALAECRKLNIEFYSKVKEVLATPVLAQSSIVVPENISTEPDNKNIAIKFRHGGGDCVNFALMITLWIAKGYKVEVDCEANKECLFKAAGASITSISTSEHKWLHPAGPGTITLNNDYAGNKAAFNLTQPPMPYIGSIAELWPQYLEQTLDIQSQITQEDRDLVDSFKLNNYICLHTRGNTGQGLKNLNSQQEIDLYRALLSKTDCDLLLLDWDSRVSCPPSYRIKHLNQLKRLTLPQLYLILENAKCFIGVDSCPLAFSRLVPNLPVIGLWLGHYPTQFVLPRKNSLNLIGDNKNYNKQTPYRRFTYNLIDSGTSADTVARVVGHVLQPSRGLTGANSAFMEQLLAKCRRTDSRLSSITDRDKSFSKFLELIGDKPTVIETGSTRQLDDFGAGYSTAIFGWYFSKINGHLTSVDISAKNINLCKEICQNFPVSFVEQDSVTYLKSLTNTVSGVYLDSVDTDVKGYQEHCLEEAKAIADKTSVILIDDTVYNAGKWTGKGTLAVDYLLANDWKIIYSGYQCLLQKTK